MAQALVSGVIKYEDVNLLSKLHSLILYHSADRARPTDYQARHHPGFGFGAFVHGPSRRIYFSCCRHDPSDLQENICSKPSDRTELKNLVTIFEHRDLHNLLTTCRVSSPWNCKQDCIKLTLDQELGILVISGIAGKAKQEQMSPPGERFPKASLQSFTSK